MYKLSLITLSISEIEATRVTDSRVYYIENRNKETWSPKNGSHSQYFNTRDEAVAKGREYCESEIKTLERRLAILKEKLNHIH